MMDQPVTGTRWDLEKDTVCFNCHKGAIQLIEITPGEALVTCTNCMAERHFTIHRVEVPEKPGKFEEEPYRLRHNIWNFVFKDRCINCGNCVDHEVNVDERRIRTICPACFYTRLYEFNMFSESRSRR
jgi:hypothetical protein